MGITTPITNHINYETGATCNLSTVIDKTHTQDSTFIWRILFKDKVEDLTPTQTAVTGEPTKVTISHSLSPDYTDRLQSRVSTHKIIEVLGEEENVLEKGVFMLNG